MDKDNITPFLDFVAESLAHIDLNSAYAKLTKDIEGRVSPTPSTTALVIEHLTGISEVHIRLLASLGLVPSFRHADRIHYGMQELSFLLERLIAEQQGEA